MRYDLWKFSLFLIGATLVGFMLGYTLVGALIGALCIIFWQLYRLKRLSQWVKNPNLHPIEETGGLVYQLHRELYRRTRSSRARKRMLGNYLSDFRKAVSILPDAIVLIDKQNKIKWANHNAYELLSIKWPQDRNVGFTDLIRDPKVADLLTEQQKAANSKLGVADPSVHDNAPGVEINSKSSRDQILNLKIIPYTDTLRMVLARDVSRLVKINRMQTDFVANVSHELKTPLTVLRGYLEVMQQGNNLDPRLEKPLAQMNSQSERMQLLVEDLLFLSKLEVSDKHKLNQLVDVSSSINAIIEMVQPKIAQKFHKIELDIDNQVRIIGSQHELHSAFTNLITNAIKYTPEKGIIRIHWFKNAAGEAVFSVKDNGVGIPAVHLPRLTQRFYRVDTDRSREGGGTGLGLAITKHVAQRHGGKLEISSKEGKGSNFSCVFPASRVEIVELRHKA